MSDTNRQYLENLITQEQATLQGILRRYVVQFGASDVANAERVAGEVLSDTVSEALRNAERYDNSREAIPWLLGIALNTIRRRRTKIARQQKREIPIRDMYAATEEQQSDGELFDRLSATSDSIEIVDNRELVRYLLAQLTETDAEIVRLSILEDLDSQTVAQRLNINPSTARVRLHRALKRLRVFFSMTMEGAI